MTAAIESDDVDARIRLRAYALRQPEGQLEGHADRHWQEAKVAIAAEDATQNIDAGMAITRDYDEHPAPGGASPGANEDAAQQARRPNRQGKLRTNKV
jgi:hypothetical protein